MHEDRKGVSDWIAKHNGYATREALELVQTTREAGYREVDATMFGAQSLRKRWLRQKVWNRLQPSISAASSSSRGIPEMKPRSVHTENGSTNVMYVTITPLSVFTWW